MAEDVIDLRKFAQNKKSAPGHTELSPEPFNIPNSIEWEAYEYEKHERGPYWILFPGGIAVLLIVLGILAQSYFFIAFTILAFIVFMMYEKKGPQKLQFSVSSAGVGVGKRIYPFAELKSFWIFNRPDVKELSVETARKLTPYIRIPLGEADPEKIQQVLSQYLPETEHKEFATDQITRSFGL